MFSPYNSCAFFHTFHAQVINIMHVQLDILSFIIMIIIRLIHVLLDILPSIFMISYAFYVCAPRLPLHTQVMNDWIEFDIICSANPMIGSPLNDICSLRLIDLHFDFLFTPEYLTFKFETLSSANPIISMLSDSLTGGILFHCRLSRAI